MAYKIEECFVFLFIKKMEKQSQCCILTSFQDMDYNHFTIILPKHGAIKYNILYPDDKHYPYPGRK